jgi:hypothetical protein
LETVLAVNDQYHYDHNYYDYGHYNDNLGVAMTILSPTNLETATYNAPGWSHIFNKNIDLLNQRLLKIEAMGDVDHTYTPPDNGVLTWHPGPGKWRPEKYAI